MSRPSGLRSLLECGAIVSSRPLFIFPITIALAVLLAVAGSTAIQAQAPAASRDQCDALVAQGVARARDGQVAEAERLLRSASVTCPDAPGPFRELAGLRLVQQRWSETVELAEQAARRDASDTHTWEIMGAAHYAAGNPVGALDAWNRQGRPAIDAIGVDGLKHTPDPIVIDALGFQAGELLTRESFMRASRRLDDMPTGTASTLTYTSESGQAATVLARLNERSQIPSGYMGWGAVGLMAAIGREIRVDVAAPLRRGDLWQPAFRWPRERRRLGLAMELPTPFTHRGVLSVEGSWERETYRIEDAGPGRLEEMRQLVTLGYADWVTSALRVDSRVAFDRIDRRGYVVLGAGLTIRPRNDRIVAHVRADHRVPTAAGRRVTGFEAVVDWRSTTNQRAPHWTSRAGVTAVSESAPLALWPGAGSILNRTALLRGRELVRRNVLSGEVFGRQLAFATLERRQPLFAVPVARIALAGFADAAQAWHRINGADASRLHVDVGIGLRVAQPGDRSEARVDLGVGLRDGSVRVSAGYLAAWGRR